MNLIQQIAMLGTFREVFLLEAFFAGTLNKISDFEIIFEIIFFIGHGWHPFFAGIFFNHEIPKPCEIYIGLNLYFFVYFVSFVVRLSF